MLYTHYLRPGSQITEEGPTSQSPEHPRIRASRKDWKVTSSVIDESKLVWAINRFESYKSPGCDGIIPAMLQQCINVLANKLCILFKASLALSYIPEAWRSVFISKPGKENYDRAKSFRPISLSSFLLKTLEKLIDSHIRGGCLDIPFTQAPVRLPGGQIL